jgi:GTP cyclohydrolase IB
MRIQDSEMATRQYKEPSIDVQSQRDYRRIEIDKVGVKDISYPIGVLERSGGTQRTVARVSMYVNLPHQFKGTHMSRFVELLNEHCQDMSTTSIPRILTEMRKRLSAHQAHIEVSFPYFILKRAPVSRAEGLMAYECSVRGFGNDEVVLEIEVKVPITALCPCSKAISDQGAHNQRGMVTVRYRQNRFVWIEEIIEIVEASASCDVFSVLKREDEKYVTERAYANPMFVEDVARSVSLRLSKHEGITWFAVGVENQESIHAHNAYAYLERANT